MGLALLNVPAGSRIPMPVHVKGSVLMVLHATQAVFLKLTGRGNQVAPAVDESSSSSDEAEEAADKPQRSFWSDSDYSTDHSHRSSAGGEADLEVDNGERY